MKSDTIAEVRIDELRRLHVKPATAAFPYMYREGIDVHWDEQSKSLHSSIPRQWTYAHWFQHIIWAAEAQGCALTITDATAWTNVDRELKAQLVSAALLRIPESGVR